MPNHYARESGSTTRETVETVPCACSVAHTPLKRGVNETRPASVQELSCSRLERRASALRTARIPKTRFAPQRLVGPRQPRKPKMLRPVGYGPVTLPAKAARNLAFSRAGAGSWPG